MSRRPHYSQESVPDKANRVLHLVLVALVLIFLRLWQLAVIQHEDRVVAATSPTSRSILEPGRRASIADRYGNPLALNKLHYNAAVVYADIRELPSIVWERNSEGKKVKHYRRREHIHKLAVLLAEELDLDVEDVEDRIHAEAAFYDHAPYIIKPNITEEQYYRLKMLQRSWAGLRAERSARRHYPWGRVGGDIIGYMGAIDGSEYRRIVNERKRLREYVRQREGGEDPALPEGYESPMAARQRLQELNERAYRINDFVGKSGIEGRFEDVLRGYPGKQKFFSDSRGNFLWELPGGKDPLPGRQVRLALSIELQEYAEQLLCANERIRKPRVSKPGHDKSKWVAPNDPWIKGGAIVAMDPTSGDIVAMASHPRMDPNDFIPLGDRDTDLGKQAHIRRWFETEDYIAEIWDGHRPLEREILGPDSVVVEDERSLTWGEYLNMLFPDSGDVAQAMKKIATIGEAVELQRAAAQLHELGGEGDLRYLCNLLYQDQGHTSHNCLLPAAERERIEGSLNLDPNGVEAAQKRLDPYLEPLSYSYDKVIVIDLCRVAVPAEYFSDTLLHSVGDTSIEEYRKANQAYNVLGKAVKAMARDIYHTTAFKQWRRDNERVFLKEKRREEQRLGKYARPYTEYLDKEERRQFNELWDSHGHSLTLLMLTGRWHGETDDTAILSPLIEHFYGWHDELFRGAHSATQWHPSYVLLSKHFQGWDLTTASAYLSTMRSYSDLETPLYGRYRQLKGFGSEQPVKRLAAAFYPTYGFGYGRSFAYRQATTQGSIFKLVTMYAALAQDYTSKANAGVTIGKLNPLTIIDQAQKTGKTWNVGRTLSGEPIPQFYKGGTLPKTLARNVGEIDAVRAIEVSSNCYFSLLTSDILKRPDDLADAAKNLSFGAQTGIELTGEIAGRVPDDISYNRNGLYALAIGQHSLVVTPLQTAVMFSAIANGGRILQPRLVHSLAGAASENRLSLKAVTPNYDYRDALLSVGVDFPMFLEASERHKENQYLRHATVMLRQVLMPSPVRQVLLEGMYKVAYRYQTVAMWGLRKIYSDYPEATQALTNLKGQLVGKTSTAENVESFGPDRQIGTRTYNHTWFGTIAFDKNVESNPHTFMFEDHHGTPELVVIVYLRYGTTGKDAAPIAAQVVQRWRELNQKRT